LELNQGNVSLVLGCELGDPLQLTIELVINESYQGLILELYGLQRALDQIERLKYQAGQEAAVNAVKVAALMYQHQLDDFAGKLKKFDSMDYNNGSRTSKSQKLKALGQRLRWEIACTKKSQK